MKDLLMNIRQLTEQGEAQVLVSIVASSGSTPRKRGAHMLVTKNGRQSGTIGGGRVEYECEQTALQVLADGVSLLREYQLKQNEIQDLGMICGGDVTVYFTYILPHDANILRVCHQSELLLQEKGSGWLKYNLTVGGTGDIQLLTGDNPYGQEGIVHLNDQMYYIEAFGEPERVYIFGGGHVSQALVPVLTAIDFACTVLEDREEFLNPALFGNGAQVLKVDSRNVLATLTVTARDYVVIMTRGHKDDERIQAQILTTPARYIGVIGSRRKRASVFENLRRQGFTDADLARVTTPIGLEIAAETPAEIAISIAAQMIQIRRSK